MLAKDYQGRWARGAGGTSSGSLTSELPPEGGGYAEVDMIITRTHTGVIERPIDEVRSQFADMQYHVKQNVHPEVHFTIHSSQGSHCAFRQEISLAGMRQADEVVNSALADGSLQSEFVGGMNAGGRLLVSFTPEGTAATRVRALLTIPVSGIRALLAPLLGAAALKALEKAFVQDKRDLEAGNYARYSQPVGTA